MRGLRDGVLVHRERSAVLRGSSVQRAAPMPRVSRRQEGRPRRELGWLRRRRQQLRRRRRVWRWLQRPTPRDVHHHMRQLWQGSSRSVPPDRQQARVLQRLLPPLGAAARSSDRPGGFGRRVSCYPDAAAFHGAAHGYRRLATSRAASIRARASASARVASATSTGSASACEASARSATLIRR
jgi:hypothetical protein